MVHGRVKRLMFGALAASLFAVSGLAQVSQAEEKKLGKTGIYGQSSLDALEEDGSAEKSSGPTEAERQEAIAKQKRLKEKYPLSRTSYSAGNERASQFLFKGIQQYEVVRARFTAINEISSEYDKETFLLKIKQKGIINERILPQDLLKYGPQYAHIGLRIRALQNTDKLAAQAVSSFAQAQSLAPSVAVIPKWIKIAKDTRQALQYHARFYQVALQAVEKGYDETMIENLALRWNAGPRNLGPNSELTTRLYARAFKDSGEGEEKVDVSKFTDKLPNLDFEVKDF